MYIPKTGSLRASICRQIALYGPMNIGEIAKKFPVERYNKVSCAAFQLKFYKALTEAEGVYSLSEHMQAHYAGIELPKIAEPAQAPVWKPLSAKYIPSAKANRPDAGEVREISFKTGGTGFAPFRGAVL